MSDLPIPDSPNRKVMVPGTRPKPATSTRVRAPAAIRISTGSGLTGASIFERASPVDPPDDAVGDLVDADERVGDEKSDREALQVSDEEFWEIARVREHGADRQDV